MDALMTSRPMMPRYGYVRVPNFTWHKSHLLKIYEPVKDPFYRDPNLQKIRSCQNILELCTNVHMIFKSLKDHTRGISTLIMSLGQTYQLLHTDSNFT